MPARGKTRTEAGFRPPDAGFTLIEAAVSMTVLAVALLSLWGTLVYCSRSNLAAEQKKRAMNSAQAMIEELKSADFETLLDVYGPSGSIGDTFNVPDVDEDAAAAFGTITFQIDEAEAIGDDANPAPLDLNGDGDAEDADVSVEYQILPVRVTIRWNGPLGLQRVDLRALLREEDQE